MEQEFEDNGKSLTADMVTGWRPRLKAIGPMPLNFDNDYFDRKIKFLITSEASIFMVIYLGMRCFKQVEYKINRLSSINDFYDAQIISQTIQIQILTFIPY